MTRPALAFTFVLVFSSLPLAQAPVSSDEVKRLRDATTVFGEIMAPEDKAIPRAILGKAQGIAIFPDTVKAGFIVGGMRVRGADSAGAGFVRHRSFGLRRAVSRLDGRCLPP